MQTEMEHQKQTVMHSIQVVSGKDSAGACTACCLVDLLTHSSSSQVPQLPAALVTSPLGTACFAPASWSLADYHDNTCGVLTVCSFVTTPLGCRLCAGALLAVKPEAIKGGLVKYVRTAYLASAQGCSVPVDVASLADAVSAAAAAKTQKAATVARA